MTAPSSHRARQTYVATTAFISLFAIVGIALYGLPFFYDFMVKDLGWSRQQVTSGNAYSKLIIGPLFGFLAGWMVDRFGPRRLMIAGTLMAGLALIGLGSVTSLSWFYVFYLFNALGYVCGGPLPNQVLLSRWFDRSRGSAMGLAYLGIGIGGAMVPLLANALTTRLGWHTALQILGVLIIILALPFTLFVRDNPDAATATSGSATSTHTPLASSPAAASALSPQPSASRRVFTHWTFPLLLVGSMCSIGAVGGTMQNLKLLLSLDKGLPQGDVAFILSLVLTASIAGRLLMGWLADRLAKKYVMLLIYIIVFVSVPCLFLAPTQTTLYLCAILFGIGLGGDYMIIPLMAADLYGVSILGRVMGIVLTADGVAEALAPMTVAAIRDHTGSYAGGFTLLMILAALGWIAVAFLPARPDGRTPLTRERTPAPPHGRQSEAHP
jgi:sugar phosphate permease